MGSHCSLPFLQETHVLFSCFSFAKKGDEQGTIGMIFFPPVFPLLFKKAQARGSLKAMRKQAKFSQLFMMQLFHCK